MTIAPNSIAAGVSTRIDQATFAPAVTRLERKPLIIGTFDESKTGITANTKYTIVSPDQAGSLFGFGFELHRMVRAFMRIWGNSAITVIPVAQTSVQATIEVSITGTATENGTLPLYIAGESVPVTVVKDDDGSAVVINAAAEITGTKELPVTGAPDGVTTTQLNLTSKSEGVWGNYITVETALGLNEEIPAGLTVSITLNDDGVGTPDISDALDALGTGANQNEDWYTLLCHSCLLDTTSLDLISAYNGNADDQTGNHDGEVGRFFQAVTADVTAGTAGLTALQAITDNRKSDMTNAVVWRPGSFSHPIEIACVAGALRERKAIATPEQNYVDDSMPGILPGLDTDDYNGNANLDIAVKSGISTTKKVGSNTTMQDFVTMYRPDSVPVESNIWRSMRHQAVSQNIVNGNDTRFNLEKWKNVTIVADTAKVTDLTAKQKARDVLAVVGELVNLARSYMSLGFLYDDKFTIDLITGDPASYVQIRDGGKGFDYVMPVVYSGEGGIVTGVIQADANTAAAE